MIGAQGVRTTASAVRYGRDRAVKNDMLAAFFWLTGLSVVLAVAAPELRHWFLVPTTICGALIAADLFPFFRGEIDILHPQTLFSIIGMHLLYVAPILGVYWDLWPRYVIGPPEGYPYWLGWMNCLNIFGIIIYRLTRHFVSSSRAQLSSVWVPNRATFWGWWPTFLLITGGSQAYVYAKMGGISGTLAAAGTRIAELNGLGYVVMLGNNTPIILFLGYMFLPLSPRVKGSWGVLAIVFAVYFIVCLLCGGLMGTRTPTVVNLFLATGMVHLTVRKLTKTVMAIGLLFLLAFMYVYGFYKQEGLAGLQHISAGTEAMDASTKRSGRTIQMTILEDLSRSDIQALTLSRVVSSDSQVQYALGRTYFGALALVIPKSIWPGRPETKVQEGTEMLYGAGSYTKGEIGASNIYGFAGEALLNFPFIFVPFLFCIPGILIGALSRLYRILPARDTRTLLLPAAIFMASSMLIGDSDNFLVSFLALLLVPALFVFLSSRRAPA